MRTPKQAKAAPDAAAERGTPKRIRCDNCPNFVNQYRPWQRFCSSKCRREFHRNEGAFGPLKDKFPKWIADEVKKQLAAALAQLPPPGPTHADVNNLLLEYDFVSRQEITPEGLAIVRAAGKKKRAAAAAPPTA